jgi:hypothetical protein
MVLRSYRSRNGWGLLASINWVLLRSLIGRIKAQCTIIGVWVIIGRSRDQVRRYCLQLKDITKNLCLFLCTASAEVRSLQMKGKRMIKLKVGLLALVLGVISGYSVGFVASVTEVVAENPCEDPNPPRGGGNQGGVSRSGKVGQVA